MRRKKKKLSPSSKVLNFEDMKWCMENDFQVYLVPLTNDGKGEHKIGVRRGGITTEGKDFKEINGVIYRSQETLSEKTFKNSKEAHNYLNYVFKQLRLKYGR